MACTSTGSNRAPPGGEAISGVNGCPMNEIERYLAEEVALDHADGLIPRREALRRLALLGLSAATASTLLAACANEKPSVAAAPAGTPPPPPPPDAAPSAAPSAASSAAPAEAITFPGPEGRTLQGAFAAAKQPR